MNEFIYIAIYSSICIAIILLIPAVRNQWKICHQELFVGTYRKIDKNFKLTPFSRICKKILMTLLLTIVVCLAFLATPFTINRCIKYDRMKKRRIDTQTENRDSGLFFHYMGGAGELYCKDCNYREEITSFMHGMNGSVSGVQCQSCGKLHAISNWIEEDKQTNCECGGMLSRDNAVFCPQCKSNKVRYEVYCIT